MSEALAVYQSLSPLAVGLCFFLLGTVLGSFSSVVYHRGRTGQSIVRPRSHCPNCRQTLGVLDLIPLISFCLHGGRCRHCQARIPWRYLLLEVGGGTLTALVAVSGGPVAGAVGLIVLPVAAYLWARREREGRRNGASEAGVTLVEVLAGVAILGISLMPALDTITVARRSGRAAEERSVTMGLARARISTLVSVGATQPAAQLDTYNGLQENGQNVSGDPDLARYELETQVMPGESPSLRLVKVTVTCPACSRLGALPIRPVTVVATVEGR